MIERVRLYNFQWEDVSFHGVQRNSPLSHFQCESKYVTTTSYTYHTI